MSGAGESDTGKINDPGLSSRALPKIKASNLYFTANNTKPELSIFTNILSLKPH